MRRVAFALVCALAMGSGAVPARVAAVSSGSVLPPLTTLSPGAAVQIPQDLTVNVVMIGFPQGTGPQQIDTARFTSLLPPASIAVPPGGAVIGSDPFGVSPYGLTFTHHYNVVNTPAWFNDAFFDFLKAVAIKQDFSPFSPGLPQLPVIPSQFLYDFCNVSPAADPTLGCNFGPAPRVNARFIVQNYFIDGRLVEQVLGDALPALLGIDTSKHTVVLINWWGRSDFIDHVYYMPNDVDVDTGVAGGRYFLSMTSGWGGTAWNDPEDCPSGCPVRRLMYYDVSASPVERLWNWDITSPDVRSGRAAPNGVPDDRLPPIWEYGRVGYRAFNDLTADLAEKFVGDVFVQLVATPWPIYPPSLSPPRQPQTIQLDITLFDTVPGQDTSFRLKPAALVDRLSVLPYTFSVERTRTTEMPSRLGDAYDCFAPSVGLPLFGSLNPSCYGQRVFGAAGADLYAYFHDHLFQYLEGEPQYEVPIFMFHTPDARAVDLGGLADQTWSDQLRQSFVYAFSSPRVFGPDFLPLGQTTAVAHEVGHHVGLHHPHDGFVCADAACTEGRFVNRSDESFYSWLGDQQSSAMGYLPANDDFGQFDLDSLDRYLTYTHLSLANQALAAIAASPRAGQYTSAISAADADATTARAAYSAMQYRAALISARSASERLLAVVDALRIPGDSTNWHGDDRTPSDVRSNLREAVREFTQDPREPLTDFTRMTGTALKTQRIDGR